MANLGNHAGRHRNQLLCTRSHEVLRAFTQKQRGRFAMPGGTQTFKLLSKSSLAKTVPGHKIFSGTEESLSIFSFQPNVASVGRPQALLAACQRRRQRAIDRESMSKLQRLREAVRRWLALGQI